MLYIYARTVKERRSFDIMSELDIKPDKRKT
jgi:hypothetical protein